MRALICDDYQGISALRVGEMDDPEPGPGEVLIDVESVVVNFADVLMVQGLYQMKPEPPFSPGYEFAGTVVVSNQGDGISPGDRVAGFHWYGGMAEKAVALRTNVVRLPDSVESNIGATIANTYGTPYHALVDRGQLSEGETLLVLGAAGGVGMPAVEIGKILGARVIAVVSSHEKAEAVMAAGADDVIRYDQVPLRDAISEVTNGDGVDVVYDTVGGETSELAFRSTRWGGRHLVVGFAAGDIPKLPLNLPLVKGSSIVGVFWGRMTTEDPELHHTNMNQILEWVANGTLRPMIQKTYDLDQGREALSWVAERKAIGRVIINP